MYNHSISSETIRRYFCRTVAPLIVISSFALFHTTQSAFVPTRSFRQDHAPSRRQSFLSGSVPILRSIAVDDDTAEESSLPRQQTPSDQKPSVNQLVTDRFHEDMLRVLESRSHFLADSLKQSMQRHTRPVILDHNSDPDGAERVLSMLRHLQNINAATEESFQIVMQAFVNRGRVRWQEHNKNVMCAADQVETLLEELLRSHPRSTLSMETFQLALQAYATCSTPRGDRDYANRADELLQRMESMFGQVSVEALVHVLHAYAWQQANLQEGDCASRATDLLNQIVKRTNDPVILMKCYNWVLEAWSKNGSPGSADQADAVFKKAQSLAQSLPVSKEKAAKMLDAESYSNAILAWSKAHDIGSAEKSHELLLEMIEKFETGAFPEESEPPLIAFNGVISAWGRVGKPDRAHDILRLMDKLQTKCETLVPDSLSYNTVLHAYLRLRNRKSSLEKSLALLKHMEEHSVKQPAIKPNAFTYNTLVKCWVQSGHMDSGEESEKLLLKMERLWANGDRSLPPNNRVFNMVINAHAKKVNDRSAARKAEKILLRMRASPSCQPDIITITSILECWSKSGDPDAPLRAETLLQEAFDEYYKTRERAMMPNLRTFTMAILCFAQNQGSTVKARALLTQLVDLYEETQDPELKPNEYPFNYVLNCAANSLENQTQAFQIATQTYQQMRQSPTVRPDSFTYNFWLKCCNNLLPPSELRAKCVSYAFDECKKDGLLTKEVLTRLFQGNPPALVDELLELTATPATAATHPSHVRPSYRTLSVQDLNPSWSRNASRR
ncbi:predicted protein [Phaeodactylum tricornutum CCAP 1055/1]|uniref:Uncharacterized protein n=1 Tax=Phaeodactylum tricornutum (strain CCAP 1055/1) TaxID=556484 RepID=B7FXP0_PHATC|nr:predicted protein [Phaeodactylum tricornutum CCAP 1055/1]EEC48787.1 predicted protein [Phaeodactylum tricornutum CCAP 1055/1]|eukprot:XP_002179801.1 predicted protein [Phaeodactylum tricornutum CCAP 1055/1]